MTQIESDASMSGDNPVEQPTGWDKFNNLPSWQVAIVSIMLAWLGKGGCDKIADTFLHDSGPFESVAIEKLNNIQKSLDKLWQIKGPKQERENE